MVNTILSLSQSLYIYANKSEFGYNLYRGCKDERIMRRYKFPFLLHMTKVTKFQTVLVGIRDTTKGHITTYKNINRLYTFIRVIYSVHFFFVVHLSFNILFINRDHLFINCNYPYVN
jgi:hypothetical protein